MANARTSYVPALGFDLLTPLYDGLIALTMRERAFKRRLVAQAAPARGHRVLDLGCGTGTLALMLKEAAPGAHVVGLDVDARILALARAKAARAGIAIDWVEGSAAAPPFPDARFDRITSSLMLHHLTTAEKEATLAAIFRLLRPGGELHVADFGKPHTWFTHVAAAVVCYLDGPERVAANLEGRLPGMAAAAGFTDVVEPERWTTPFGTLAFLCARVPDTRAPRAQRRRAASPREGPPATHSRGHPYGEPPYQ